jgi:hypothetical protein
VFANIEDGARRDAVGELVGNDLSEVSHLTLTTPSSTYFLSIL